MTDTIETPTAPVETTDSNPQVVKPFVSPKPYDDDVFEAYEADDTEAKEAPETEEKEGVLPPREDPKEDEVEEETSKEEDTSEEKTEEKVDPDSVEEMSLTKTINGKEVDFKIKDAIQAYVKQEEFNRNMDKRITHVSQREQKLQSNEQKWQRDQEVFKSHIGNIIDSAKTGKFIEPIRALAKLALGPSASPTEVVEFEKKYFEELDQVREVYTKLTPEQREAFFAKRALAEATARARQLEEEKSISTQTSQLKAHVDSILKSHDIKEEEYWGNYEAMEKALVGEDKPFKSLEEIKAEDILNYTLRVRHEEKILQAGKKLGIQDEAILDEVSRITLAEPNITVEDVIKVIKDSGIATIASPDVVENLNRKAGKTQFNRANSTKKENGKIEGYDDEDLEELYRRAPRRYQRPAR